MKQIYGQDITWIWSKYGLKLVRYGQYDSAQICPNRSGQQNMVEKLPRNGNLLHNMFKFGLSMLAGLVESKQINGLQASIEEQKKTVTELK